MRTGRITLSVYNENGGLQEKAFNFSFDRYVNYMHAYRILDKLHKPNYRMYFRGVVKKPGRNPVMTWGEVCSAIRDWRFYGRVSKSITVPAKGLDSIHKKISWYKGNPYTFIKCNIPYDQLWQIFWEAGLYELGKAKTGTPYYPGILRFCLLGDLLQIITDKPVFSPRIEEL
jgi:hypothetical protein